MSIQALFVCRTGPYFSLLGEESCWDIDRDARNYHGTEPVIAHPPCQLFVNFAAVNWKRYQRQLPAWYPGGTDGGCFAHALESVRRWGGALEHPASSHAWEMYGLKRPPKQGWSAGQGLLYKEKGFAEYTCEVYQSSYGHRARKKTWLLFCGAKPPFELNWEKKPGTAQIGWFDRNKETLGKKEASRTPVAFAEELIKLAEYSRL